MVCITPRPPPHHHHHQQFSHNGVNKSNGNEKWIVVVLQWQLLEWTRKRTMYMDTSQYTKEEKREVDCLWG